MIHQVLKIQLPLQVRNALRALEAAGFEAWIVGGCVRDALLGITPKDYDITTSALPEQVHQVFSAYKTLDTGIRHGTVTVLYDGMPLEITTYRVDLGYSDGRHPDAVSFTGDFAQDAARRDFTMNAIGYNESCGLKDYFHGVEDISAGLIRCVGDPELRFREDALRIMRALRFSAVLGFSIHPDTLSAARQQCMQLKAVSAERISAEFQKLLCGKDAHRVLTEYIDILGVVFPELLPMQGFAQHNIHHIYDVLEHSAMAVHFIPPVPALRLAALLHDVGKPLCFSLDSNGIGHFYGHAAHSAELAERLLPRLRLDSKTYQTILTLVKYHDMPIEPTERSVKRALGKLGTELFFQLIALKRADNLAQSPLCAPRQQTYDRLETIAQDILARESCFSLKDLAVNGTDLLAAGVPAGKPVGAALQQLLQAVIDEELPNDRDALLRYIAQQDPPS